MTKISTLLAQIDSGTLVLPEFQRGFVWSRSQVRGLIRSLYLNYPVGGVLLWEADVTSTLIRNQQGEGLGALLLDGQQRMTSLYGVIRGRTPQFFDGDPDLFERLSFNFIAEEFRFWPRGHQLTAGWIDVTQLFGEGVGAFVENIARHGESARVYLDRVNRLAQIVDRDLPEQRLTDEHHDLDIIVDIFNQLNSSGTTLSKGDLAIAKACSRVPDARRRVRDHMGRWREAGYKFRTDWVLRNITAAATSRVDFDSLDAVSTDTFATALEHTPGHIDSILAALSERLGIDHDRVLLGRTAVPVLCVLLQRYDGVLTDATERDRMLYWYVVSALTGRHRSSTETALNRDLALLESDGLDGLVADLVDDDDQPLKLTPDDFDESNMNARTLPLLYVLAKNSGEQAEGKPLAIRSLFPRADLNRLGFPSRYVNAVANYICGDPEIFRGPDGVDELLSRLEESSRGAIARQCIPQDPALWTIERYPDFLAERRILLAGAAQKVLDGLRG
ncbi:DUF262 domain-containing protein [Nocardia sp. NPDC005978]|uniref:GmrSD restriction endonuclease domain-containing protein n=1 Tax=Nocardia sp. NPDC005978 TaxID=3156725 RepID=UPI00339F45C8